MPIPLLIAFGANIEPLPNLLAGLARLRRLLPVVAVSTVYRTRCVGDPQQPDYLNGALLAHPDPTLTPHQIKRLLREVESAQGRVRADNPNAARPLDLDIALLGGLVVADGELLIPDPAVLERPFVALPVAELAPGLIHPLAGRPLAELARAFGDHPVGMTVDVVATAALGCQPKA